MGQYGQIGCDRVGTRDSEDTRTGKSGGIDYENEDGHDPGGPLEMGSEEGDIGQGKRTAERFTLDTEPDSSSYDAIHGI